MASHGVGVLGATSLVGRFLLSQLARTDWRITAFSRRAVPPSAGNVAWRQLSSPAGRQIIEDEARLDYWICVAPIWILPQYFPMLEAHQAQRVVALSSTSRFTKTDSSDHQEQETAQRLADAEHRFREWAEQRNIDWVILRPTLIYGSGEDKNISEIARFIRRFGFFPLFGQAKGLRQPVHAEDVASACVAALSFPEAANQAFNLSGGETLTYREMAGRVFSALGRRPHLLTIPLGVFRLGVSCLHILPRYRYWSVAMAERMNRDLVFDHASAAQRLGFKPRPFRLTAKDLPI